MNRDFDGFVEPYYDKNIKKHHYNKIKSGVIDKLPSYLGVDEDEEDQDDDKPRREPKAHPVTLKYAHGDIHTMGYTKHTNDEDGEKTMQYACKGDYLSNDQYHAATTPAPGTYFDDTKIGSGGGARTNV